MNRPSITRTLDSWIPKGPESSLNNSIENKIRARVLIGLFLSSGIILMLCFLVFLGLHLFSTRDFSMALIMLLLVSLVVMLQTFMFYKLGNVATSAIIFSMTYFGMTLGIVIATGGWLSPIKQLFFCAPAISFLVGGRNEGVYMSFLVLFIGIILLVACKLNLQFFQMIHEENRDVVEAVVWVISLNILGTCLAVYDAILRDFSQQIARRR